MYVHVYIYMCIYIYVYIYMYTHTHFNAITKYRRYIIHYVLPSSAYLYECPSSTVPKTTLQHIT